MASSIPNCQTAAWIDTPGPKTRPYLKHDIPIPAPGPGDLLIKLSHSGVCHSDVHALLGETKRMAVHIGGHEGVGTVISAHSSVSADFLGARVGVKWLYSACLQCEVCEVNYVHCPNQSNSGRDVLGTFQQYVVAPARFVTRIPEGLESQMAAPLLCAGITVYSAIKKAGLKKGEWMVILGAGGGLGHLGVQIAKKMGYRVIAVGKGEAKKRMCLDLGANVFLDSGIQDVEKEVQVLTNGYGVHAVVCATGLDAYYEMAFKLVRIMGTVVCVGFTLSQLPISPFQIAIRGYKVVGSTVGTEDEMNELLQMAVSGDVVPKIELFELEQLGVVVERIASGSVAGKVVLKIPE
jgi:propanol-preferring alcohol dehydrogenase